MPMLKVDQIEALLPQTQCELCEYPGCRPYAEAMVTQGVSIDRCLPGGVRVLERLGEAMDVTVDAGMYQAMQTKQSWRTFLNGPRPGFLWVSPWVPMRC